MFRGIVRAMGTSDRVLGAVVVTLAASAWAADGIGYAQASGYFKKDTRPTLYQPLNLLDARDATAWCSPTADPLNELLTFGFNGPIRLDELHVSTGNNFDEGTWNDYGRARKFVIKSGKQSQTFSVEDVRGMQTVSLAKPLLGSRFTIEVLDQFPAEDPDASVCVTDIVFVAEGKPLNGNWLTTKLKYDKGTAQVMGTWYSGFDKTPDRFLSFNFDGTFRYSYEPFDTSRNKEKVVEGKYDVSAGRLVLEVAGKKHALKFSKDPARKGQKLALEGEVPEDLKGEWRSLP